MAASTVQTKALSSDKFVESSGAVLFDLSNLSDIKVCLVQHKDTGEWMFAKGRRNQGEARKDAAVREVIEETGYRCRLLPVTMPTRATAIDAHADVYDKAHLCENLTEPFMCHIRTLKHGKGAKIIWWYIAVLEEDGGKDKLPGEAKWKPLFMRRREALNTLTFANDRELLLKAFELLEYTFPTKIALDELSSRGSQAEEHLNDHIQDNNLVLEGAISKTAAKKAAKILKATKRKKQLEAEDDDEQNEREAQTRRTEYQDTSSLQEELSQTPTKGIVMDEGFASEHKPSDLNEEAKMLQNITECRDGLIDKARSSSKKKSPGPSIRKQRGFVE
ncbi:hypothetical protein N0V90_004005 [Kalmusia sp. IMI 367209]|nr:hypothetical protein N0V90_004005 [Kalmusia sp. IMI 367209]